MDPRMRIWIQTKMSRIRNTAGTGNNITKLKLKPNTVDRKYLTCYWSRKIRRETRQGRQRKYCSQAAAPLFCHVKINIAELGPPVLHSGSARNPKVTMQALIVKTSKSARQFSWGTDMARP
jgi:hypothetical protein